MSVTVIIPAGGIGSRLGESIPKQFIKLDNIPILARTLLKFQNHEKIYNIIISINADWIDTAKSYVDEYNINKVKEIVIGGATRQESINNALQTDIAKNSEIILIHDAVRPFVSEELISNIISSTIDNGAVIPILTPKETVKELANDNSISKTLPREKIGLAQTPQGFWTDIISKSMNEAMKNNIDNTDDSALVEKNGFKVYSIKGEESNIKITTKIDLQISQFMLNSIS